MTDRENVADRPAEIDQAFDDLVCEVSAKLEAGEAVDLDGIAAEHPQHADRLGKLLPTLQAMAELGHSDTALLAASTESRGPGELKTGVLGDYRIVREIGRGGMGVVYEAEQVSLGRTVALKVLPFAAVLDPKHLKRFQNEARAAASLRHPNIVQVHSVGCERAVHFYAMDYVEGQTLAEVVRGLRRIEGLDKEEVGGGGSESGERKAESGKGDEGADFGLAESLASGEFAPLKGGSDPNAPTAAYTDERTPEDRGPVRSDRIHAVEDDSAPLDADEAPMNRGTTNGEPDAKPTEPPPSDTGPQPQATISTERSTKSPAYFRSIAEIGVQVARALDHAHEQGVVHRDVKPSNVILDNQGKPWVTDFGLARIDSDATLTISGDLLGTVRYMSPEQALARRIVVDHRTDVYSLGVTLYELLTLQPAFTGQDREELLRQIAFEEPKAPRRLNKAVPAELETIVLKAIAKNPTDRFDTAQDLADDLERFLEDRPIRAKRPSLVQRAAKWSRRHRSVVAASVVSTTLVLGFAVAILAMSNVMIREERDEKETALSALAGALKDRDAALEDAKINLQAVETQRQRAESNFRLAMDALDTVYLEAIGQDRMLGETEGSTRSLSSTEKQLLRMGLDFYGQIAEQNPESGEGGFEVAGALVRMGLLYAALNANEEAESAYRQAIAQLSKLIELRPNDPQLWRERGRAYHEQGEFHKALADYGEAVRLDPDDWELYCRRADTYKAMGDFDKAIADCGEAIRLNPGNGWPYRCRANAYRDKGDMDRAFADYAEAIRLSPNDRFSYFNRAKACEAMGDLDKAIADYSEAIRLGLHDSGTYWHRAGLYLKIGNPDKAIADCNEAIRVNSGDDRPYRKRAAAYLAKGDIEKAFADYAEAIRVSPNNPWNYPFGGESPANYRFRGRAYRKLGQFDKALEDHSHVVELIPEDPRAWLDRAQTYQEKGDHDKALADCEESLRLDPQSREAFDLLVWACAAPGGLDKAIARYTERIESSPKEPGFWFVRARLRVQMKQWDQAIADFSKAIELKPEQAEPWIERAKAYEQMEQWDKAIDDYSKAIKLKPDNVQNWLDRALCYWSHMGEHESAVKDCDEAIRLDPNRAWAYELRAWSYRDAGDHHQTIADANEALRLSPKRGGAYDARGCAYASLGNLDQAISDYTQGIHADPERVGLYRNRAKTYARLGRCAEALEDRSQVIKLTPEDAKAWLDRAELHVQMKQWEQAFADFSKAIELSPEQAELWKQRAHAYEECQDWDKAAADFRKASELRPQDVTILKNLAEVYRRLKEPDAAFALYSKAIEAAPEYAEPWWDRALIHLQRGDYDKAIADCNEAIRLKPDSSSPYRHRGLTYLAMEEVDKAFADFDQAIRVAPTLPWGYWGRAKAHLKMKNYDKAAEDYSQVIKLKPDDPQAWLRRAELYIDTKQWEPAIADASKAIGLEPENVALALIRAQILLMADRNEEYRQACVEILDRFGQSESPFEFCHAARACVLAPKATPDPMVAVKLAAEAVSRKAIHWHLYTLGMAHFRAGQPDEAAQRFQESLEADPAWEARFLNWLGLALVHHERGDAEEARRCLAEAVDLIEQDPGPTVQDRLEGRLLRREVERLLGKAEEKDEE